MRLSRKGKKSLGEAEERGEEKKKKRRKGRKEELDTFEISAEKKSNFFVTLTP